MIELLESLHAWHWMLLGIVLLGLEALGTRGFLLGAGVAAFVTCLVALSDVEWQVQTGVFIFLAFFFTLIYFKKIKKLVLHLQASAKQTGLANKIPGKQESKYADLFGKTGKVELGNQGQTGKVRVADKLWDIRCKQILNVDDEIRVKNCDGSTLHVSKLV